MVISASRRTDIPRFYSNWLINRIRQGYCTYPNPFNRNQINRVSLLKDDVDVIVFWTKYPKPLLRFLPELDSLKFRYYFQFTVNGLPVQFEPNVPQLSKVIETFHILSTMIGPQRVIWRYDPIIISNITPYSYHYEKFAYISKQLKGKSQRVIISLVDDYRGAGVRLSKLKEQGIEIEPWDLRDRNLQDLLKGLVELAGDAGMKIESCAEGTSLVPFGIAPGKCIDDRLIYELFKLRIDDRKDPTQRQACGCVTSRDIGIYGTCNHQCVYCYATGSTYNREEHNPDSPSLVGWYEQRIEANEETEKNKQGKLF